MIRADCTDEDTPLVTVVIPAYNAQDTLDETLQSVRGQTYRNLEIIVIDDGSRDRTRAIAEDHAMVDPRVQVITQPNAGVAAARNRGWQAGSADLFSFVDADDLWTADKTERQLAALRAMPEAGMVYSWFAAIDEASRILRNGEDTEREGEVFDHLLRQNFIGNGSAILVRRCAIEAAHGFETAMRAADAGGCEDILFYTRVAEHYPVALAPGHLIGYRHLANSMSSDLGRMLRSWAMMVEEMVSRHPAKYPAMDAGFYGFAAWLVHRAIELSQPRHLPGLLRMIARRSRLQAMRILARAVVQHPRRFARSLLGLRPHLPYAGARFEIGTPGNALASDRSQAAQRNL